VVVVHHQVLHQETHHAGVRYGLLQRPDPDAAGTAITSAPALARQKGVAAAYDTARWLDHEQPAHALRATQRSAIAARAVAQHRGPFQFNWSIN
jgi:hypothetical protein